LLARLYLEVFKGKMHTGAEGESAVSGHGGFQPLDSWTLLRASA